MRATRLACQTPSAEAIARHYHMQLCSLRQEWAQTGIGLDHSPAPPQSLPCTPGLAAVAAMDMPPRDKGTTTKTGKLRRQEFWCPTCRSTTFWNSWLCRICNSPHSGRSVHTLSAAPPGVPLWPGTYTLMARTAEMPYPMAAEAGVPAPGETANLQLALPATAPASAPAAAAAPAAGRKGGPVVKAAPAPAPKPAAAPAQAAQAMATARGSNDPAPPEDDVVSMENSESEESIPEAPILYGAMIARGLWHAQRSVHYWERLQEVQQRFANYEKRRRSGVADAAVPAAASAPATPANPTPPATTPMATTQTTTATQWLQPGGQASNASQSQAASDTRRKRGRN